MGAYKHIKETFQKEYAERSSIYRQRISAWKDDEVVARIERPTNIARARELGYKALQGYVVARVRVRKGRRKRKQPDLGRKASKSGRFKSPGFSLQAIAEQKSNRKFENLEVLNSYFVGENGTYKFFEVILIDPNHNSVKINAKQKGRVYRGLTSATRKARV
ncbi:50S ribosomal protein L15e [Candidatus Micrarchaeota archaeon]|nr:50S ribosomal protein L15e [Candidatus Micrarchaeota archaeon]